MEIPGPRPSQTPVPHTSPAQLEIWKLIADAHEPLTAAEVAQAKGLHVNTAREHLDGLVAVDAVNRVRHHAGGRGRPSWAYKLTTPPDVVDSEYAGLATALARQLLRSAENPTHAAHEAGREWGRELAQNFANATTTQDEENWATRAASSAIGEKHRDAITHLTTVLTHMGFAPQNSNRGNHEMFLTRCPLLDASQKYPEIVCQVHSGLIAGILDLAGGNRPDVELTPFARPGACVLTLNTIRASAETEQP